MQSLHFRTGLGIITQRHLLQMTTPCSQQLSYLNSIIIPVHKRQLVWQR